MAGTVYKYPIEENDYPGRVVFTPLIETPADVRVFRSETNESIVGEDGDVLTVTGGSAAVQRSKTRCELYFPSSLNISDAATYNNVDLGIMGGAAESAISAGGSALSGVMSAAGGSIESFIDSFKTGGAATSTAKMVANRVSKVAGGGVSAAVKSQTRVTTNPNTRTLFESVPLRTFSFTFKMIPQSASESQMITDIIRFFRSELYPEEIKVPIGNDPTLEVSVGYNFPNKFAIEFLYKNKPVATRIKPAYLSEFSATYNSSGMGMHPDGGFTEVDISMTFMESKALSRKDILAPTGTLDTEGGF